MSTLPLSWCQKLFSVRGSWKTSLSGVALALCGGTNIADEVTPFLSDDLRLIMHAFCLMAIVTGLISAKDFNKTNAPAVIAKTTPVTIPMGADPNKTVADVK